MRYRLLGIDLDGTLLDRQGRLSARNAAAVNQALDAGVLVVPCTGRAWRESLMVVRELPRLGVGVFVTGAAICDTRSGDTLDVAVIEPGLALELVQHLFDLPEAVLVLGDAKLTGHDYLVTGRGTLTGNTQWWFQNTGATVRFLRRVTDKDLHHTLRVGVVASAARMAAIAAGINERFAGRVVMHHFEAVQMPNPEESVHILEIFGAGVDKWRGLQWIAQQRQIDPSEVAVIGDEINDMAMLNCAGCGIAMGNAIDQVKAASRYVTRDCDDSGLGHAIEQLLSGAWE